MASRQASGATGEGGVPVADRPESIRNVVLVAPPGSGKTTLVETLLVTAGVLNRAGTIAEGSPACDFDDAKHRPQGSTGLALAPLTHDGTKVNLLGTPGYAGFVGKLRAFSHGAASYLRRFARYQPLPDDVAAKPSS